MQNGKSSDVPISVIKKTSNTMSPILAHRFNYLMGTGKFPDMIKLGKITPIFKKEDEQLLENDEKLNNFVLEISNTSLPQVEHTKFFGVIIENKLTWQPHLSSLVKKLSCCTGRLNRITQFIPADQHTNLYHTLFEIYLSYGVSV